MTFACVFQKSDIVLGFLASVIFLAYSLALQPLVYTKTFAFLHYEICLCYILIKKKVKLAETRRVIV